MYGHRSNLFQHRSRVVSIACSRKQSSGGFIDPVVCGYCTLSLFGIFLHLYRHVDAGTLPSNEILEPFYQRVAVVVRPVKKTIFFIGRCFELHPHACARLNNGFRRIGVSKYWANLQPVQEIERMRFRSAGVVPTTCDSHSVSEHEHRKESNAIASR